ncbi:MAG: TAXI family TRAP transporter solute-binding subunit [Rhodovibrionaceae bacterium]|nr:TAXI family TRAP transporter solute-binding subunit [Rhodovibrionaceae bacterium]
MPSGRQTKGRTWIGRLALALALVAGGAIAAGHAQDLRFFRIGTGSTSGTYFPIGGIIASAISNPPGSRQCERGGSCGVPGLIAVVQSTNASVANLEGIVDSTLDSGFAQADIAYWAYHGTGIFTDSGEMKELRAISNLYPESLHLVVRVDARIRSIQDLKGKRVSIDRAGSGTQVDARLVLDAFDVAVSDFEAFEVGLGEAADMMMAGELDAFFMVAGTPANAIIELATQTPITLVPIDGEPIDKLLEDYPFFDRDIILSGVYRNVGATPTLSVGAQWITSTRIDAETVYQITRALWHANTRHLLDKGHPKGRLITLDTALNGVAIPLHEGAERYYREIGVLGPDEPAPGTKKAASDGGEDGAEGEEGDAETGG